MLLRLHKTVSTNDLRQSYLQINKDSQPFHRKLVFVGFVDNTGPDQPVQCTVWPGPSLSFVDIVHLKFTNLSSHHIENAIAFLVHLL